MDLSQCTAYMALRQSTKFFPGFCQGWRSVKGLLRMNEWISDDVPPALAVFAGHRSVRFFRPEPLAAGDLDWIVEAGRRAPTDAQGHMYALLRITDSSNLMEVYIPATAQASSLAGLWMGDVSLTNVSNKVSNGAQATATLTDGVITGLTVVGSGGFGYSGSPAVTIAPPHANSNVTATATATVAGG